MYSYLRKAYFIIFFLLSFLSEKIGKETASCISPIGWFFASTLSNFRGLSMADPRDAQTLLGIASSEPLKQLANLYETTASASTPFTKDLDQKQIPSPYMAQITQAVLERLKETMPAQTPISAPNTVLETPDSATISPEPTDQNPEPLLVMGPES